LFQDCQALIAAFEEEEQKKKEEMDEIRRLAEEEGIWEVAKILEAKTKKVSKLVHGSIL
jgi:hypothetical protein